MAQDVAVTGEPNSGVPTGTPGAGGVPQGTPAPATSDANEVSVEQLLAKLAQADEDRKRVQSLKDREVAAERKRVQDLAAELENIKKQGMTEAERIVFERDQLKARLETLEAEARQRQEMDEYERFLSSKGIDTTKLDKSSPEAMANSAWEAVFAALEASKATPATTPTPPATPQNNSKVITGSGGVPHTKPTRAEMMKAVGARNEDEFGRWMERDPKAANQWLKQD